MNYAQQIIAFLTSLVTSGTATQTFTSPTESETVDIFGEKYEFTETGSATVTAKKVS